MDNSRLLFLRLRSFLFGLFCVMLCLNFVNVKAQNFDFGITSFTPNDKFLNNMIEEVKKNFTITDDGTNQNYTMFYDELKSEWIFAYGQFNTHLIKLYANNEVRQVLFQIKVTDGSMLLFFDRNMNIKNKRLLRTQNVDIGNADFVKIALNTSITEGFTFYRSNQKIFDTLMRFAKKTNDNSVIEKPNMSDSDKSFFHSQFEGFKNTISPPLNDIKKETKEVKEEIKKTGGIFGSVIDGLKNALLAPLNLIKNAIDSIKEFLRSLFIPYQSDMKLILDRLNNFFSEKLGALGETFSFFTNFLSAVTTNEKNLFIDLPPIYFFNQKLIDIDYDLRSVTTNYKTLYDIYYNFSSFSMIIAFFGFLASEYENFFKE